MPNILPEWLRDPSLQPEQKESPFGFGQAEPTAGGFDGATTPFVGNNLFFNQLSPEQQARLGSGGTPTSRTFSPEGVPINLTGEQKERFGFLGDSSAGLPGEPLNGSIDPTGGASGDFDLSSLGGIDQAIAQLQSQIEGGRQGSVPDYSAFFKSPGYDFRFQEGVNALDKSAAARGKLFSGGYGRELQRYGQGLATSEFGNYANRLASLAGIGQSATQYGGQLGAQAGSQVGQSAANIGQSIMAGGTAQASGIVGANNAWQQGIGGAINSLGSGIQNFGAQQGWWGGFDPSSGITWDAGRVF